MDMTRRGFLAGGAALGGQVGACREGARADVVADAIGQFFVQRPTGQGLQRVMKHGGSLSGMHKKH